MEKQNSSKYYYENSTILINKFAIKDKELLQKVERNITTLRIAEVESGKVDVFHHQLNANNYLSLHKYIFSDIYDFAGEVRDEAIYKDNAPYKTGVTPFCYPEFIYQNLDFLLKEMNSKIRGVKTREEFLQFLASYYSELNIVHPFREGNGRTLRTYYKIFVEEANKILPFDDIEIDYSKWDDVYEVDPEKGEIKYKDKILETTILDDLNGIMQCFDKVILYKEKRKIR